MKVGLRVVYSAVWSAVPWVTYWAGYWVNLITIFKTRIDKELLLAM